MTGWSRIVLGMTMSVGVAMGAANTAVAEPTQITVRVISKDAKFIGTSMGGALVTIREAATGELLAKGRTSGDTGSTDIIMIEPRARGTVLSGDGGAKFETELDIKTPRQLEVTVSGPMAQRQATNRASSTMWVIPGKHITGGDAWLIELPGLVVDVLAPPAAGHFEGGAQDVTLEVNVAMMCGCPIEPDGLWDANGLEVAALLRHNGNDVGSLTMTYAGETGQFAADWSVTEPGLYEAIVYAFDPDNGNTGLDRVTFAVSE